ncbi:TonB-dependent receptor [Chitinophaga arvensicola]|uniref:Iron complex outermembrane recepter protein n=1 Tax=Chitinophaga arvensicola TaxID=29529 RepID=A0A1I0S4Y4_9BACT|nr:TonB-dependent receptor [Chitinophaga arvensicola]SEW49733.1 iron complex outermembrane recepter protein [Chitinophaga arvensicola]
MNNILRLTVTICCLFFFCMNVQAQTNPSLYGKILTSDGQPVTDVAVVILETRQQTVTANDGSYRFDHVRSGTYTIKASVLGLPAMKKMITVTTGVSSTVDFTLSESAVGLREVEVVTRTLGKELNKESKTVAKLPLRYLENPQVYTTLSDKLLTEQIITDLSDGLKNAPGIVKMQGSIGRSGDGAVYYNLRGFPTRVSMVDGIPGQTNGEIDMANIQSVEIIKGPSGTLFGSAVTSFGGLINVETKKPLDTLGGEISYTGGSYDLNRITADIYGPISKNKKLTGRVNAAYHTRNSFQDAGFRKSFFLAPVIAYQFNERTNITLGAEFYSYEGTNPSIIFLNRVRKFSATSPEQLNFDWARSYTSNDITLKAPSTNVHGRIDHKLGRGWVSSTNFSRNIRKTDGMYQYEFVRDSAKDDLLERNVQLQNATAATTSIQQNFTGEFRIGGLRNRLIVGLDYLNQSSNVNNSAIVKYDSISGSNPDGKKYAMLSLASATNKIALSKADPTKTYNSNNVYGVYASDVINITDNLLAMLSLRLDYFASNGTQDYVTGKITKDSRYYQTAFSPKFGLVYQVIPGKVSVFGNYMNGFSNVQPVTQPVPGVNGNFKPQHANQAEGGVKLDLLDNRLTFTASYYDIQVENITRSDKYKYNGTDYTITVQDGTQRSKGVELELMAAPVKGLNIMAGYSHNNSKLNTSGKDVDGTRPASAGPADIANAWISYTIPAGKLRGFGAGVGGNKVSEHVTANSTVTGKFTFPAYTLLNATAFYDARQFRVGLKLDNITNAEYYVGQGVISPQMPFNFSANVSLKF